MGMAVHQCSFHTRMRIGPAVPRWMFWMQWSVLVDRCSSYECWRVRAVEPVGWIKRRWLAKMNRARVICDHDIA